MGAEGTPAVRHRGRKLPPGEGARKAVHLSMAAFALLFRWLSWPVAALAALAAFAFNLFVLPRVVGHRMASGREDAGDTGVLVYPLVVLALVLLFHRPGPGAGGLGLAAFGLLAGGDALAGIAGMKWGRHPLPWNPKKTWEGAAGYLLGGGILATLLLWWCTPGMAKLAGAGAGLLGLHLVAIGVAVVAAALLESVPHGLDDNVLPPLLGTLILAVASGIHAILPATLFSPGLLHVILIAAAVNAVIAGAALAVGLLEPAGVAAAWVLGVVTWGLGTWKAYVLLWIFLGVGTLVTRWKRRAKRERGLEDEAQRGLMHVVANGALCFLGSILVWLTGGSPMAAAIVAASLAAALADTMASEIGKALGRKAYSFPALRPVPPGTDGAISIPGTLAGLAGAALVAGAAVALGFLPAVWLVPVLLGGFGAMLIEGLLPGLGPATKAGTNLANTVIGVLLALAIRLIIP
ncbi:MAG: DUF92 domain-containing protein [Acidobacteria bacterium]|nr:DUF92 domain-containing protein [Acidobacteriota bacterium]